MPVSKPCLHESYDIGLARRSFTKAYYSRTEGQTRRVDLRILRVGMSEHEVAAHRIFHPFCHVLATMEQPSLLED